MTYTFKDARVLITGGLGFIGSNLARRLVTLGADVTVIDNLYPKHGGHHFNVHDLEDELRVVIADVCDRALMNTLICGQDYVFNLSGQTSHLDSMEDPFTDLEMNCRAPLSILEACKQQDPPPRIVFASTRQIYGRPDSLPVSETHPLRPIDINGVNKLAGEWYHRLYGAVHELAVCTLRLTNTYGPRMRIRDARQSFLGVWIRYLLERQPFEVWGGKQLRDFTYVDDVVEAFLLSAQCDEAVGQIYNVGGKEVISLEDLARLLIRIHPTGDFRLRDFPENRRRIDIGDYYADDQRIRNDLGWQPKVTLEDGLQRSLRYFSNNLAHYV